MAQPRRSKTPVRSQKLGVAYARFSTNDSGQNSTDEQNAINREIAEDDDITVVAWFADEGVSRSVQDRPDLVAMFAYSKLTLKSGSS